MKRDQRTALQAEIAAMIQAIGRLCDANEQWKQEIIQHFRAVVEAIRGELRDAHREQLELLDDRTQDHEQRVRALEEYAALTRG